MGDDRLLVTGGRSSTKGVLRRGVTSVGGGRAQWRGGIFFWWLQNTTTESPGLKEYVCCMSHMYVLFFLGGRINKKSKLGTVFSFPGIFFLSLSSTILWFFAAGKLNIVTYGVEMALCHFLTCSSRVAWLWKKVWFCSGGFQRSPPFFFWLWKFGEFGVTCETFWELGEVNMLRLPLWAVSSGWRPWVGFFGGGPWVGGLRLVNAVLTQSWTHPENVPQVMGGGENCRSSTVEIWDEQGQWRPGPEMRPEDIMKLLWRVMYLQI